MEAEIQTKKFPILFLETKLRFPIFLTKVHADAACAWGFDQ